MLSACTSEDKPPSPGLAPAAGCAQDEDGGSVPRVCAGQEWLWLGAGLSQDALVPCSPGLALLLIHCSAPIPGFAAPSPVTAGISQLLWPLCLWKVLPGCKPRGYEERLVYVFGHCSLSPGQCGWDNVGDTAPCGTCCLSPGAEQSLSAGLGTGASAQHPWPAANPSGLWSSLRIHLPSSGLCKFGINLISLLLLLTESERMEINACWEGQADSLSHSPGNFH